MNEIRVDFQKTSDIKCTICPVPTVLILFFIFSILIFLLLHIISFGWVIVSSYFSSFFEPRVTIENKFSSQGKGKTCMHTIFPRPHLWDYIGFFDIVVVNMFENFYY